MRRALARKVAPGWVQLSPEEAHHLVRVLRLRSGDEFEAITGDGGRFRCCLEESGGRWQGRITGVSSFTAESPLEIRLVQALVKHDRFDWVVQKAVELGVSSLLPAETVRSEVRLEEQRRERRLERWQRIMEEAVKQSGRTRIPVLHAPRMLDAALAEPGGGIRIALDELAAEDLAQLLAGQRPEACTLIIGPEGGWDRQDREVLERHGVVRVRLGPRILRTETAAVAGLTLIQYHWGDLARNPEAFHIHYSDV